MPSSKPTLPSPPPSSSSSSSSHNRWGPYSSSKDFDANIATILIIVVGASAFSFALHAAITFLLRCYSRRRRHAQHHEEDHNSIHDPKEAPPHFAEAFPTLVFTSGTGTKVAGTQGAECAICLADFVEGERVTVLPACNHGFHVQCVKKWLSSKPSCPTCRRSCEPEGP